MPAARAASDDQLAPGAVHDLVLREVIQPPGLEAPARLGGKPRVRSWRVLAQRLWVPVLLFIVAMGSTGLAVASHQQSFSPIDEYVYYDYLGKLPDQVSVRTGEPISLQTRDRLSCEGVLAFGHMGPTCSADHSQPDQYVYWGKTSASGYTPVYFWLSFGAAKAFQGVLGVSDLSSYRLTGGLWLGAALVVFFLLLRRFRVPKPVILGLGLVLIASPYTWLAHTFISTDASLLLMGALMPLAAIKVARYEWPAWTYPLLAVIASLLKVTNLIPVLVGTLILVFLSFGGGRIIAERRAHVRRWWVSTARPRALLTSVVAVALFYAVQKVWMAVQSALAIASPPNQFVPSVAVNVDLLTKLALTMVIDPINQAIISPTAPVDQLYPMPRLMTVALATLCLLGVAAPLVLRRGSPALRALRWPVALGVLSAPVVLAVGMDLTGRYFDLPPRYGAGSLPVMMLMVGLSARSRLAQWTVCLLGLAVLVWNVGYGIDLISVNSG